jgi:D-glycero-alpha-D-manno-heptose-7-phosphate kinase
MRLSLTNRVLTRAISASRKPHNNEPLSVTVMTVVDAPMGSGLGASSASAGALIGAYCAYLNLPLCLYEVAYLAYQIERVDLGLAGGQQDQFSAAFGGINHIEFLPGGPVIVNPLPSQPAVVNGLESSLVCFFRSGWRQYSSPN